MCHTPLFLISLFFVGLLAEPAHFTIYRKAEPPVIDGLLNDWTDSYLQTDVIIGTNTTVCYYGQEPPQVDDMAARLYAAHVEETVYYALKITKDDHCKCANNGNWVDQILQGNLYYMHITIFATDSLISPYPDSLHMTSYAVRISPDNGLPIYEWSMPILQLFGGFVDSFYSTIIIRDCDSPDFDDYAEFLVGGENIMRYHSSYDSRPCLLWTDMPVGRFSDSLPPVQVQRISFTTDVSISCSPNPFTSATTIKYNAPGTREGKILIYDLSGRLLLSRQMMSNGGFEWKPHGLPAGIYLLKAIADGKNYSRKLILQR